MKRPLVVVVAFFVAVCLAAAPAAATAADYSQKDRLFVSIVRKLSPAFTQVPAKTLIRNAHLNCRYLRSGATGINDLVYSTMDSGLTQDQATSLVYASVQVYCPDHKSNI